MLKFEQVKKFYGRFPALDGLSLDIEEGSLFGFVGPNGAGKTTALKIMAGIIYPDDGSVTLNGLDPLRDAYEYKSMIGYVPDAFGIYTSITVREYMEFFASCLGIYDMEARKRTEELLGYVELSDKADAYVDTLSRGMKQRLALARALIDNPSVLIMDEPTSGLDPRTRYEFKQIVGELSDRGKTIIISSHILSDISELCTDIGIIDQGSIIISGKLMDVMKEVTSENPITISMYKNTNQAARFLKDNKKVKSIAIKGNDLMINFDGNYKDEAELLKGMVDAGLMVRSFSREKGSLESIFMQLTGHGEEHTVSSFDAEEGD